MSLVSSASGRVAYREMAVDLMVIPPASGQHILPSPASGGWDGNRGTERTLLLVGTSIGGTSITSLSGGDDTGLGQQRVGQGRFAVVDMSNNTHVTNIARLLHEIVDLVDGEAGERSVSTLRVPMLCGVPLPSRQVWRCVGVVRPSMIRLWIVLVRVALEGWLGLRQLWAKGELT